MYIKSNFKCFINKVLYIYIKDVKMQCVFCKMRLTQHIMSSDKTALSLDKFYVCCFKEPIGKEKLPDNYVSHSLIHSLSKHMSNIMCQI